MNALTSFILLIGLATIANSLLVGPDVTIHNLKLFYGREEFFIKAMCYNPTPLGLQDMKPDNTGGKNVSIYIYISIVGHLYILVEIYISYICISIAFDTLRTFMII